MKKRLLSLTLAVVMAAGALAGCGGAKKESWKVTCPWAPSGVAAMVSQKAAEKSPSYSEKITLVAEAVKGDAATVNTWVADTKANSKELVFAGEGLFSITSILDPAKMQFDYSNFAYVENLYSSIFVLSEYRGSGRICIDWIGNQCSSQWFYQLGSIPGSSFVWFHGSRRQGETGCLYFCRRGSTGSC